MKNTEIQPIPEIAEPFSAKVTGDHTRYSLSFVLNPQLIPLFDRYKGQTVVVDVVKQTFDLEEPKGENHDTMNIQTVEVPGVLIGADGENLIVDRGTNKPQVLIPFYHRDHVEKDYESGYSIGAIHNLALKKDMLPDIWGKAPLTSEERTVIYSTIYALMTPDDKYPQEVISDSKITEDEYLWKMASYHGITDQIINNRRNRLAQQALLEI